MKPRHFTALALVGLLAACGHQVPTAATTRQDVWRQHRVPSYDFVYTESGMAGACRLLVHVRENRVDSAVVRHRCGWLHASDAQTIDGVLEAPLGVPQQ